MAEAATPIEEWAEILRSGDCRIELVPLILGPAPCGALLFVRRNGRWKKLQPMLLPRENGGAAELLDDIATIARGSQVDVGGESNG